MPSINQLPVIGQVSPGDQIPVYTPNNGDARRMSVNALLQYFQQTFASPTLAVNLYVPGSGFNITVPTPVSQQQWMLLQPAGTLATGTITLPLNTGVPDGTTVLITTTQEITSLTIALNGASAIYGAVTSLGAGCAAVYRFYQPTNSWYNINAETVLAAGIAAWLTNPTSANLRAAMTDETGTGLLVFNTSPTLVTPILGVPTSGTLTNCTGLPIATGVSGLAANVATFLATPSSANLAAALTDETGTGANVFANTPTLVTPAIGAATGTSLALTSFLATQGSIINNGGSGKVGYAAGAGGAVTQATSKSTGVSLSKQSGQITMNAAALAASTTVSFTLTNTIIEANDVLILNHVSAGTAGAYTLNAQVSAGSASINVRNVTLGSLSEAIVIQFIVINGAVT
jgi:hypothetical protein